MADQPPTKCEPTTAIVRFACSALLISEPIGRYRRFAESYHVRDSSPTKELSCMRYALRPVRQLYGSLPVNEFGPLALKAVQQHLIDQGLCRTHINARINRMKRFFKWAVSEELVPSSIYEALRTVPGLRFGRTTAREKEPVRPVSEEAVDATLSFLSPQVAAMGDGASIANSRSESLCQRYKCNSSQNNQDAEDDRRPRSGAELPCPTSQRRPVVRHKGIREFHSLARESKT